SSPEVSIRSKPKPPSAYSPTTSCEQSIWLAPRVLGPVSPEPHKKEAPDRRSLSFPHSLQKPGLCICILSRGSVARAPARAELVVQPGALDIVPEFNLARCDIAEWGRCEGSGRERVKVVELDIQKFALGRPAVTERVFDAAAHRPTAAGIALLMAGSNLIADEKF